MKIDQLETTISEKAAKIEELEREWDKVKVCVRMHAYILTLTAGAIVCTGIQFANGCQSMYT